MGKLNNKNLRYILTLFFFLLPLSVLAQSEPSSESTTIEEEKILFQDIPTVYGASKYEQKVTEAPSSVSIVTSEEIKKYGYRTLADILKSISGFYVTYDRNYSYIGVRGFNRPGDYNSRILLLIDGHKINDNIYDGVLIGTDFILDIDLIDRVEVIRGPSSSIYGTSAFFAVINVITKRGRDFKGAEVSGDAASFDTYTGRTSYGNKFQSGLEVLVSGTAYYSKGQDLFFSEFDSPDSNNGISEDCDYDKSRSFFSKFSFHDFTLQGGFVSRKKGIPTASYDTIFNDSNTFTIDDRGYIDLKYEHAFTKKIEVMSRIFYDYYYYHADYSFDYPPVTVNKDYAKGLWWGGELQFTMKPLEQHKLIAGSEFQDNIEQDQGNYDEEPYYQYLDDERRSKNWALYLQDEITIVKNLIFNLGVRYDHYDAFGGTTNPRLGLIYNPFEKTTFKLLYGEAFRAPSAYELYYDDGGLSTKSNPDLQPERIRTYEIVYEQYLGEYLLMTASGFYYKIKELISQQIDPADELLVFTNVDEVEAKGFEIEFERKWENGLEARTSYTFQETEDQRTGEILTNSPKHLGKLNVIVPMVREKLFISPEVQYMSKRKTLEGNYASGFFITNLTIFNQNLIKRLEISGSIYNIFDKKYSDPGSGEHPQDTIQQDGRVFSINLTYAF